VSSFNGEVEQLPEIYLPMEDEGGEVSAGNSSVY
jgi:hypothetical protein